MTTTAPSVAAIDARRRYIDGVQHTWTEHAQDCAYWINDGINEVNLARARQAAARAAADRLEWLHLIRHDHGELLHLMSCWPAADSEGIRCGECDTLWTDSRVCPQPQGGRR